VSETATASDSTTVSGTDAICTLASILHSASVEEIGFGVDVRGGVKSSTFSTDSRDIP